MARFKPIVDAINDTEYLLAKYKIIKEAFPDVKTNYCLEFMSKTVNKKYTKIDFDVRYSGLFVLPYCEVNVKYGDKEETVKIHSSPKASRLVYLMRWRRHPINKKQIMKFSRLNINLKNNNFKDEMLHACHTEIIKFISANPGYHLDDKYLEPRLKKLLTFI